MGCALEKLRSAELDSDILEVLCEHVSVLWKEWPMDMKAVTLGPPHGYFSLRGSCPHCRDIAGFMIVVNPLQPSSGGAVFTEPFPGTLQRIWAIMQCQSCLNLILGCAVRGQGASQWSYEKHYPLGKPDDAVHEDVPKDVAENFSEALRCRWVDAYNATGEMCRRALEASCNEQVAPSGKLIDKIDWLFGKGLITDSLKNVAHKIRLGGNYGAHAPEDPMNAEPMTAEHADVLIEFMREYFQHVYVMPKKLAKYDFTKAGMKRPPTTP